MISMKPEAIFVKPGQFRSIISSFWSLLFFNHLFANKSFKLPHKAEKFLPATGYRIQERRWSGPAIKILVGTVHLKNSLLQLSWDHFCWCKLRISWCQYLCHQTNCKNVWQRSFEYLLRGWTGFFCSALLWLFSSRFQPCIFLLPCERCFEAVALTASLENSPVNSLNRIA